MPKSRAETLRRRFSRYLKMEERLKPQYVKMDRLMELILRDLRTCRHCGNKVLPKEIMGDAMLKDNFAKSNTAWKSTKFSRLSVERVKAG